MSEHAKLSPSSADRWLVCPASIVRTAHLPDVQNEYSLEGTAAHKLAEYCLTNKVKAQDAVFPQGFERFDTSEFRDYVQTYLDYIAAECVGAEVFVEQKLEIFSEYDVWGTADVVGVMPKATIKVIDLKFGRGVVVDASTTQLILYAIGGMSFDWLLTEEMETVEVHVFQPRRNHIDKQSYSVQELRTWIIDQMTFIKRAAAGTDEAFPGAHCKWCKVKATCRERAESLLADAAFDFSIPDPNGGLDIDYMTNEELVRVFASSKLIREYLEDVETHLRTQMEAGPVDGLKWVQGRVMRKVVDPAAVEKAMASVGLDPFAPKELLGIGALEKLIKGAGHTVVGLLGQAVSVVEGKPVLTVEADTRKTAAGSDFA